ncbi:YtxH domain-containing protein [Bacillus sp. FJAT-27251]|uniref:YtxH domain-containing protein n=1 Tax=Bacillus sp. FJAT-27251 TaxID=1684142 RepID=UPI001E400A77|nr:YtxH domain-containing protein [Bacillus sp. FJAT-27251]
MRESLPEGKKDKDINRRGDDTMTNREFNGRELNGREVSGRELNARNDSGTNSRDFMIGAIIGGLAGAAAALFLTPKSGKELRTTLNEQKDKAMTKSSELASTAKEKANSLAQTVSQQSSDLVSKVKGKQDQGQNEGPEGDLENVATSMAETSSMEQTHTATNEEIQRKLQETQAAFDETEDKLNQ